jgi:glycosyltransferase involved in cell wall biosynthesis
MISIVIPVYNERESLAQLHAELLEVLRENDYSAEIIFVDDGSTDGSWRTIQELAEQDPQVQGIRLRRNFGKASALSAGFDASKGHWIFTMDADLQDDPHEIPRFLNQVSAGYDVVSGWKKRRHDPWHKVYPSLAFNAMVSWLTGIKLHDHNCGFKCYRADIFDEVRLYGELHRFVPVLAAARGYKVTEVVVNHRAREHGSSKYGLLRIPKGFLDLVTVKFLTGFGQRPQHVFGTVGLIGFLIGMFGLSWLTGRWIMTRLVEGGEPIHLHQRALFYYSIGAVLLGAQFMSIGFLAELFTAFQRRSSVPYSVAESTWEVASIYSISAPTRRDESSTGQLSSSRAAEGSPAPPESSS